MARTIYSDTNVVVGTTYSDPVFIEERCNGISFQVDVANKTGSFSATYPLQVSNADAPESADWIDVTTSSIATTTANGAAGKAYDYNVTSFRWVRVKVVVSADDADITIKVRKKMYKMGSNS